MASAVGSPWSSGLRKGLVCITNMWQKQWTTGHHTVTTTAAFATTTPQYCKYYDPYCYHYGYHYYYYKATADAVAVAAVIATTSTAITYVYKAMKYA
jgi:alpha-L-arabinofuranosidase